MIEVKFPHLPIKAIKDAHNEPHGLQNLRQMILASLVLLHGNERLLEQHKKGILRITGKQAPVREEGDVGMEKEKGVINIEARERMD